MVQVLLQAQLAPLPLAWQVSSVAQVCVTVACRQPSVPRLQVETAEPPVPVAQIVW